MRPLVLSVLLLCVLTAAVWEQSEGMVVKLCGREFLRAIIYTCGASRWRRLLQEQEFNDVALEDKWKKNISIIRLLDVSLVPDVLNQESKGAVNEYKVHCESCNRTRRNPSKRDLNHVLANMCCQVGCRKTDLSVLC